MGAGSLGVRKLVGLGPLCYIAKEAIEHEGLEGHWDGDCFSMAHTDEQLVARAQEGQIWAFEELVTRHQQKAYSIAFHMSREDPDEAQDLVQEAFLRAFRKLKKFRGESAFYTWLYRIVVNTCLDAKRQRNRRDRFISLFKPRSDSDDDSFEDAISRMPDQNGETQNPLSILSGRELSRSIRKAIDDLPEKQKTVFQLKVLNGLSIKEISAIMGSAEGTVKSHLFRATRFMQTALKEWAGD